MSIRYLSLFSGIGAFEKALKNIGIDYELVGFSEIDKYAIKSYCAVHGVDECLNLGDISKIDLDSLPKNIDLITHGSPCQDFSIAGRLAGGDKGSGTRSSLMWCTVDIVGAVRPKYVVWENVKNLLSKTNRHNFDGYLEIMNELGYNSYYKVLNAKDFGIPQNRERVFTVSIRKDIDTGYTFPEGFELKLKLKDMLEETVDEKYYLNDAQINRIQTTTYNTGKTRIQEKDYCDTLCARDWKDPKCVKVKSESDDTIELPGAYGREFGSKGKIQETDSACATLQAAMGNGGGNVPIIKVIGKLDIKGHDCVKRVYSDDGIAPTLTDMQGGNRQPKIMTMGNYMPSGHDASRIVDEEGLAPTVKENHGTVTAVAMRGRYNDVGKVEQQIEVSDREIANSITTVQKDSLIGESIKIKEATKAGFKEACEGDGINISSRIKYQRGNVQHDICQTLISNGGNDRGVVTESMRIRKLTPRECWRLMGFSDEDFDKAAGVPTSNTQLYKQAGNSIVVDVLEAVLGVIFCEKL